MSSRFTALGKSLTYNLFHVLGALYLRGLQGAVPVGWERSIVSMCGWPGAVAIERLYEIYICEGESQSKEVTTGPPELVQHFRL